MRLTTVEGSFNREDAKPGMAYFAGTGPADKCCGHCKYRGYYRRSRFGNDYHTPACSMFWKLAGKYGPRVRKDYRACKYFEPK